MSLVQAAHTCLLRKYASFSGQASRAEYWWFSVVYVLAVALAGGAVLVGGSPWWWALALPFVAPMLSVSVRRLHDTGRSGASMFIALIPIIGPVIYLYLMTLASRSGSTRWGPEPSAN